MTDAELDAIEARANVATPGPWEIGYHGTGWPIVYDSDRTVLISAAEARFDEVAQGDEDETFIAAARSDVPALIAELRAAWSAFEECDKYRIEFYNDLEKERDAHHATDEELRAARERLKAVERVVDSWIEAATSSMDDRNSPTIANVAMDIRRVLKDTHA